MCCQLKIKPLDKLLAETILRVGQFTPYLAGDNEWKFNRVLANQSTVLARYTPDDLLMLTIRPGVHSYADHVGMRENAAIMFEIAWRYAEKCNGQIWQVANIAKCRSDRGESALIAEAGLRPFKWEDICLGFREVFNPSSI